MSLEKQLSKFSNKFILKRPSEDTRQYVYRILSTLILNMVLMPGQRMNEQELASLMNVSRTPLHDTFPKLSRNRLVDIIPMKGAFVSKVNKNGIKDSIWLNEHLCMSIIHGIFISDAKKNQNLIYYMKYFPNWNIIIFMVIFYVLQDLWDSFLIIFLFWVEILKNYGVHCTNMRRIYSDYILLL